ncbi:Neurogenic locus notch protein-like [Melia azedarach]|uniref:Neurogenic locus notch protein-like n=1 Tax=Melia azedarach TaxID=155640 RepID=A0ACC1Y5K8_MELAZ|nr:Neurogenic locus notch protein-like [Melia azedarach]
MGRRFNSNSTSLIISSYHLLLLVFSVFISNLRTSSSEQLMSNNPLQDIACAVINCGEGKCMESNTSMLGFDCECNPGWKKIQIGPLTFPSCVLPNCTVDFQCGNGSPPPPPPPAPIPPPPINFSDPCALIWCGDGKCASNGIGHTCQCYQGSANLFNNSAFACFKQCSLGADCNGLGLGFPAPPPPTNSGSPGNAAPSSSSKLGGLTMILLAATILTWF